MCDANSLPSSLDQFGLVLITNTLCHLPDPLKFLNDMVQRIVPDGILVIADFYGWDEMFKLPKVKRTNNLLLTKYNCAIK